MTAGTNQMLSSDYLCVVCGEHANEHGAIPHQFVAKTSKERPLLWAHDWSYHDGICATCRRCRAQEVDGQGAPEHCSVLMFVEIERLQSVIAGMIQGLKDADIEARSSSETPDARPLDEWHEDMGDVLWWHFPIEEPPYCGSPLDTHWQEHELEKVFTHWTPIPIPHELKAGDQRPANCICAWKGDRIVETHLVCPVHNPPSLGKGA